MVRLRGLVAEHAAGEAAPSIGVEEEIVDEGEGKKKKERNGEKERATSESRKRRGELRRTLICTPVSSHPNPTFDS